MPCHAVPYIPYHTIQYNTIPYHTIPYHTIPYHTIPYHTIPYHTIPWLSLVLPALLWLLVLHPHARCIQHEMHCPMSEASFDLCASNALQNSVIDSQALVKRCWPQCPDSNCAMMLLLMIPLCLIICCAIQGFSFQHVQPVPHDRAAHCQHLDELEPSSQAAMGPHPAFTGGAGLDHDLIPLCRA